PPRGILSSPFESGAGPALVYFAFRGAAWLAEHFPPRFAEGLARMGAAVGYRVSARKRNIVRKNMARVLGEGPHLDVVVRSAFHFYARYWLETFRLGRYSKEALLQMVECDSTAVLAAALEEGRGVVSITPHFGFYDVGVSWVGAKGYPLTTAAEVLRPRALFEWFAKIRAERGVRVIPASPGAAARKQLAEVINKGEGVALVAERDLGRRGVWVKFFGEQTTFPAGPSILVARTGAALITAGIYAQGFRSRYRVFFERVPYERTGDEGADVESIAQKMASALEEVVRIDPPQWHLFSTNWPSDEPHLPPRGPSGTTSVGEGKP
ncbi:MAG: lysophospholipid acyltransferase family protein, partial [Acidimicrobiia bacterium]